MALKFNHNLENNYKFENYEEKFGQFQKKFETAMKLVPMEATILLYPKGGLNPFYQAVGTPDYFG